MEDTLKELCREARDRQNITIQDLADETGISISTIGNFFASKSKAPNVYNAGAICAALGVSLDRYFGITETLSPEDQIAQLQRNHQSELEIAHMKGCMEQMAKTINYQRKKARLTKFAIYGLMLVCSMFMAVIVGYIFFDYRVPNQGLIQSGEAGVFAWIVFLLLAVGIGIFAAVFIVSLRYTKEHTSVLDV